MVSKIAVIALVAIVAAPILLGYAMNLDETAHTEFKESGNTVNNTEFLLNGVSYSAVRGDFYQLNTDFGGKHNDILPYYESLTSTKSSYPMQRTDYNNDHPYWDGVNGIPLSTFEYIYYQTEGNTTVKFVTLTLKDDNSQVVGTYTRLYWLYYDFNVEYKIYIAAFTDDSATSVTISSHSVNGDYTMALSSSSYTGDGFAEYVQTGQSPDYVDLSAGYHFTGSVSRYWYADLPTHTKDVLFTVNLDSITDANYEVYIVIQSELYLLTKTTTDGIVNWNIQGYDGVGLMSKDLYYDPNRNDNTYQIYFSLQNVGEGKFPGSTEDDQYRYIKFYTEFRYVGGWPTVVGEANYYLKYTNEFMYYQETQYTELDLERVGFSQADTPITRSPTMRIDDSHSSAFEHQVIKNNTYNPADFKTNPSTTISNIQSYGSYLIFGGNTYNITDGNITLGTHSIPVRNIKLQSVETYTGHYENRINGYLISTDSAPSSITFGGTWEATVKTDSMVSTTVIKTEWVAGHFAWDGIDDNFLLVGLLTSLGVFIALGIYSRRSKGNMIPLMLVAGGAAFVFLIMM